LSFAQSQNNLGAIGPPVTYQLFSINGRGASAASWGSGRAMAPAWPWRETVSRRCRATPSPGICQYLLRIFGVLRGESARAPHRANASRARRKGPPTVSPNFRG